MMNGALEHKNNYDDYYYTAFPLDVTEEDDEFLVTCDMPGLEKENIHISYLDGILTIFAKKQKNKKEGKYLIHERSFMNMKRELSFKDIDPEAITANYNDGVLVVHVKMKPEKKAKTIIVE